MKANKIECQQLSKEVHDFIDTEKHLIKKSAAQDPLDVGGTSDHLSTVAITSARSLKSPIASIKPKT